MSTKQREERRSPGTAVGRVVVSVAYKKIGNALDALFGQSIRLQIVSECADNLRSEPSLRSSR
eukprot:3705383-Pleurochrysis_carterae.AAC.1